MPCQVVSEDDVIGILEQRPIMFLQRRLALPNQFRPLPDVSPDDSHPDNPDHHERGQKEQPPKKVGELRRQGGLRRRRLRQGQAGNQPHRLRPARKRCGPGTKWERDR